MKQMAVHVAFGKVTSAEGASTVFRYSCRYRRILASGCSVGVAAACTNKDGITVNVVPVPRIPRAPVHETALAHSPSPLLLEGASKVFRFG